MKNRKNLKKDFVNYSSKKSKKVDGLLKEIESKNFSSEEEERKYFNNGYDAIMKDLAQEAKSEGLIPTHEEWENYKKWRESFSEEKEFIRVRNFILQEEFMNFREALGLEDDKVKFVDKEYIDELEKTFGSREAALGYLEGIRHAAVATNNPNLVKEALGMKKKTLSEERVRRLLNFQIEKI